MNTNLFDINLFLTYIVPILGGIILVFCRFFRYRKYELHCTCYFDLGAKGFMVLSTGNILGQSLIWQSFRSLVIFVKITLESFC